MEQIKSVIMYVIDNKVVLLQVVSYIIAAATIIVKLTPTQKDDTVLNKIVGFISKYIALNTELKK